MLKTLTVGIPAYNEDTNIIKLVKTVLSQKLLKIKLEKIIVSSDGSTDKTVQKVKSINNKKIIVIINKNRKGIARGLNQIINKSSSEVLVTLDADISIKDNSFLQKLIEPIIKDNFDLTSSAIKPLKTNSLISKVLKTSMDLKEVLFETLNDGSNIYTCHGLARAYSKRFYKKLSFSISVGNDMFSYLRCISSGFKFYYAKNSVVFYKLPENFVDHQKQSERFFISGGKMNQYFNTDLIKTELNIPYSVYLAACFKAIPILIKNPFDSFIYFFIQLYLRFKPKSENAKKEAWEMAVSSKKYE